MSDPGDLGLGHRARVLVLPATEDAKREIERIGPVPPALHWLAAKAGSRGVRLERVPGRAAALLKQEMLAVGGDCAISPNVARFDETPAPVILLGTLRQYDRLMEKLQLQPLGLRQVADELGALLTRYEQTPPPLQLPSGKLSLT